MIVRSLLCARAPLSSFSSSFTSSPASLSLFSYSSVKHSPLTRSSFNLHVKFYSTTPEIKRGEERIGGGKARNTPGQVIVVTSGKGMLL